MTKFKHARPPAWLGKDFDLKPNALTERMEQWIGWVAKGKNQPSEWSAQLREDFHRELELESGFFIMESEILNMLDYQNYSRVFEQVCTFLGKPVAINLSGQTIKEVMDHGVKDDVHAPKRGHMSNQELAFHSDRADITLLGCWSTPKTGGEFKVASTAMLIQEIEKQNPDWINALTSPIPHDLRDEGAMEQKWASIPILTETNETFVVRYIRKFNDSMARFGVEQDADVKKMLDGIDAILNSDGFSLQYTFKKGSLAFVNNHTTLHSRNAFTDSAEKKRLLLRCWFSSEFTRPLDSSFLPIFHNVEAGAHRGGIGQIAGEK